jgi:hypothetical protein
MVIVPGYHKQGSWASFEIRDEEGHCYSDSLKIEMVGKGVRCPIPRYLYCRGIRSDVRRQSFKTHDRDRARHAMCRELFAAQVAWHPAHCKWGPGPLISCGGSPSVVG